MTLSVRGRMVASAVAAAGIALGALLVLAGPEIERRARQDTQARLLAETRLMGRVVEDSLAAGTRPEALDPVVDEAARDVDARVTIVATDGRVLGDSALSGRELLAMENHARRPEVMAALAGSERVAERQSATLGAGLLYSAVPVHHQGAVVGVARLSHASDAVTRQARRLWGLVALALALAFVATGALVLLLSRSLARALDEIMETARQLARGNLSARAAVSRPDELGELARLINHSADELQARIADLASDRARTDAILTALDDGVLAVDHSGAIVLANARLSESMGLEAPIGRHYREVVRQSEIEHLIEDTLHWGEHGRGEVALLHRRRLYTVTSAPFPGAQGASHGAVLTFNDGTERHRVEQIRRDFVANASHELRTPLTSIRGFVEALEDGAVEQPATARRFLSKIRSHADRMTVLVDDLLELGGLESGTRPPHYEEVRPREVAEEVAAEFEDPATRKRITLSARDFGAPVVVTDPERLLRILENLVDNAVKYTPEAGHVEITTAGGPDGCAVVEVIDNGPGIGHEHLERIFERFYRVDKARSRDLGGTGLGLSIVKHLAESMGATVSVASEPGHGCRFTLLLPPGPEAMAQDVAQP